MSKGKIVIFSILTAIISFFIVVLTGSNINYYGAQTVYRVYLNGESIGLIKNPNQLDNYINNEQEELKEKYNVDSIHIPLGLEIKQELTYNEDIKKSSEIYEEIKDKEPFTIEGYSITIYSEKEIEKDVSDDEEITDNEIIEENKEDEKQIIATKINVIDKQVFKDAVDQTILAFIDEEQYNAYLKEEQAELKELEEGTLIENVYIKEDVYIKKDYLSVNEEIFMDSKTLAKYLLYGTTSGQKTYTVKMGDTMESIANANQLNVREFLIANRNISSEEALLYSGQQVVVDIIKPVLTIVEESVEVKFQEKKFKTEIIQDPNIFVGYTQVIQKGVNGEELVTMKMSKENGKVLNALATSSIETKAAVNRIVKTGSRTEFAIGNAGIWAWPTRSGYYISTYFGYDNSTYSYTRYHEAIDITGTGCGSPIYAANDGTVITSTYGSSLGYYVTINHNNGYVTWYAHLQSKPYVSVGQAVEMGQVIGKMGSTGESTGCHLHFVTSYKGTKFNPLQLY